MREITINFGETDYAALEPNYNLDDDEIARLVHNYERVLTVRVLSAYPDDEVTIEFEGERHHPAAVLVWTDGEPDCEAEEELQSTVRGIDELLESEDYYGFTPRSARSKIVEVTIQPPARVVTMRVPADWNDDEIGEKAASIKGEFVGDEDEEITITPADEFDHDFVDEDEDEDGETQ